MPEWRIPLAAGEVGAAIGLKVDAFGHHGDLARRNFQIALERVTQFARRRDHMIAAPGAEASDRPPYRSERSLARLKVVNDLSGRGVKRQRHRSVVHDQVRLETIVVDFARNHAATDATPLNGVRLNA